MVLLAKIYDSIFGLYKYIDWIFIYGNCFVLFLVVEYNNPIENISNSMNVMIFCSIKSWAGRELNPYITKSLKIHKSLTNSLIIKNYTLYEKLIFWQLVYDLWMFKIYEICSITLIAAHDLIEQKIVKDIIFKIFLISLL